MLVAFSVAALAAEVCVVARVGDQVVTCDQFQAAAARTTPDLGDRHSDAQRREILDKLVIDAVLLGEARRQHLEDDPAVQKEMVKQLLRRDVYGTIRNSDFSEAELEAWWNSHRSSFEVPEKVQIKRILIKVNGRTEADARALADGAARRLAAGESFKTVAGEVSEDAYNRRGGDFGFVSAEGKPGLDPEVVKVAFSLPIGGVSPVFRTAEGYNVVEAANRREAVTRDFEQMKGSVLRSLKNEAGTVQQATYVAALRKQAKVTIDERTLAAVAFLPAVEPEDAPPTEEPIPEE